jgi:hypothetical protein
MNATNKIENRGRAYTFALELAEHLEGWSAEQAQDERELATLAYLQHEDGARVVIRNGFDKPGRWSFFPTWPKGPNGGYRSARDWGAIPYDGTEPHMTSAQGRSASSIAGQFSRHFGPTVVEMMAAVQERRTAEIEWRRQRDARARELATVSGGELWRQPGGSDQPLVYVGSLQRKAGSVTFHPTGGDETVRIEGWLTQREALDLGALLNPVPDQQEDRADRERRLQLFAATVIEQLESEEEWSSETLDAISHHALAYGLAFSDAEGMFRGHAWARMTERQEKRTECLMCQREPISDVDDELCDSCLEHDAAMAQEIDDQLYS